MSVLHLPTSNEEILVDAKNVYGVMESIDIQQKNIFRGKYHTIRIEGDSLEIFNAMISVIHEPSMEVLDLVLERFLDLQIGVLYVDDQSFALASKVIHRFKSIKYLVTRSMYKVDKLLEKLPSITTLSYAGYEEDKTVPLPSIKHVLHDMCRSSDAKKISHGLQHPSFPSLKSVILVCLEGDADKIRKDLIAYPPRQGFDVMIVELDKCTESRIPQMEPFTIRVHNREFEYGKEKFTSSFLRKRRYDTVHVDPSVNLPAVAKMLYQLEG